MNQNSFPTKLIAGLILATIFGIALYLRAFLPHADIFVGDIVKFSGVDAYYHMRLIENFVYNFPHLASFDPYLLYPTGHFVTSHPFFDWLLGGIIWIISLGSPTQHTIDLVGVYMPAILGALATIPVYIIGKELFNRWAGLIAAGLIAIMPGEFLGRSILGFADHHVAETLLSTIAIMFLILAIKVARERQLSLSHLLSKDWPIITRPLVYSLLAGIFLATYLLAWKGGILFAFIIFAYFVIQFIIDHLKAENTDYLCIVGTLCMFTASIFTLALLPQAILTPLYLISLPVAFLTPPALAYISRLMAKRALKPYYYPAVLFGIGIVGIGIFYIISPSLVESMLRGFGIFIPSTLGMTVLEMAPLLFPGGNFSLAPAWGNFTTSFFISIIALGIILYKVIRQNSPDKTFLVVWSLLIFGAALGQRRFAYYQAVNVAVLTGYFSWLILQFAGFKEAATAPAGEVPQKAKKKAKARQQKISKGRRRLTGARLNMALGIIVVFVLVFYPNIGPLPDGARPTINTAGHARFAPDTAWCKSLLWLKDNTPDPFDNPDFYNERYETPPPGESYEYPESAYGIMSWWDYGYWITRIGHRIPIANPTQRGAKEAAQYFTAGNEATANDIMIELDARYVVIDYDMVTAKFWAIATWSGKDRSEFFDVYYKKQDNRLTPVRFYYPEYYRSFVSRLYNFNAVEAESQDTTVISYEGRISSEGIRYNEITSTKTFPDYQLAAAYVEAQDTGNYRIGGTNPFISPVAIEALEHYRLIHVAESLTMLPNGTMLPTIKIFERID